MSDIKTAKSFWDLLFFGLGKEISFEVMVTRAIIVYVLAIILVRLADRRFFARNSIYDIILLFIWSSLISRAITGNSPFLPTVGTAMIMVFLHRIMSFLALRYKHIGWLYKGDSFLLVKNGQFQKATMDSLNISEKDVMEWVRIKGKVNNLARIKEAYLERNGEISVVLE